MAAACVGLRLRSGHDHADGGLGAAAGTALVKHHDLAFLADESRQVDAVICFIGGEAATEDRLGVGTER